MSADYNHKIRTFIIVMPSQTTIKKNTDVLRSKLRSRRELLHQLAPMTKAADSTSGTPVRVPPNSELGLRAAPVSKTDGHNDICDDKFLARLT